MSPTTRANGCRSDGNTSTSGVFSSDRCRDKDASTHAPGAGGNNGYAHRCPGRCDASRDMRSLPGPFDAVSLSSRAASAAERCRSTSCVHA